MLFYTLHEYFTISSSLVHSPRFSISNDILSPRLHDGASDFLGCQSKSNVQYLREIARVQIYCELRSEQCPLREEAYTVFTCPCLLGSHGEDVAVAVAGNIHSGHKLSHHYTELGFYR